MLPTQVLWQSLQGFKIQDKCNDLFISESIMTLFSMVAPIVSKPRNIGLRKYNDFEFHLQSVFSKYSIQDKYNDLFYAVQPAKAYSFGATRTKHKLNLLMLACVSKKTISAKKRAQKHLNEITKNKDISSRNKFVKMKRRKLISPDRKPLDFIRSTHIVASCEMDLIDFPMDVQHCKLTFGSCKFILHLTCFPSCKQSIKVRFTCQVMGLPCLLKSL